MLRVAAVQHDIVWEDPAANISLRAEDVRQVAAGDLQADLVVFSEMFTTGFSMDAARLAEPPDGPTTKFLAESAQQHQVWTAGSVPETTPGHDRPTNRFVLAGPNGELHRYSKVHPFSYAGEHKHYSPGSGVITVDVAGVRVTPLVCYDLRFSYLFWDAAADTDCFVVVANWPAARRLHWMTLLRARAIENQAYVVGVNRVGTDGYGVDYAGDSLIFDPVGAQVADAGDAESVITATVDPEMVASTRSRYPFLADRLR